MNDHRLTVYEAIAECGTLTVEDIARRTGLDQDTCLREAEALTQPIPDTHSKRRNVVSPPICAKVGELYMVRGRVQEPTPAATKVFPGWRKSKKMLAP